MAPSRSNRPYPMLITCSRVLRAIRQDRVTALPVHRVTDTTGRKTISQQTLFPARQINHRRRPTTTYRQLAANLIANYKSIITCLTVTKGVILSAVYCWYCRCPIIITISIIAIIVTG